MAYREDYLNPATLAKADELDRYFASKGKVDYSKSTTYNAGVQG
jgi:hypothetical protein